MAATYKHEVLLKILVELHPGKAISCKTTYDSIQLYDIADGAIPFVPDMAFIEKIKTNTQACLVPESVIQEKYTQYLLDYNLEYNLRLLRSERNQRLYQTDIYTLPDFPHASAEIKAAWFAYRQALRDITITNPAPMVDEKDKLIGIEWPTKP